MDGARRAYQHLAARLDVLSWSKATFAERERWLWDEAWELAQARGLAAPPRCPPEQVPAPDMSDPLFPEGCRRSYRDLTARVRHLAAGDAAGFAQREASVWAALWALASRRGLVAAPDRVEAEKDEQEVT